MHTLGNCLKSYQLAYVYYWLGFSSIARCNNYSNKCYHTYNLLTITPLWTNLITFILWYYSFDFTCPITQHPSRNYKCDVCTWHKIQIFFSSIPTRYIIHLQTEDSTTQKDMTQDGPANPDILGMEQEAIDAVLDKTERKNGVTTTRV